MKKQQLVTFSYSTFWDILVLMGVDIILRTNHTPRIGTTIIVKAYLRLKQVKGVWNEHATMNNKSFTRIAETSNMQPQATRLGQS